MRFLKVAVLALSLLIMGQAHAAYAGQADTTGRLVEILHNKGVLDDASYAEVKGGSAVGAEEVNRRLIEALRKKGILDDASYAELTAPAAPATSVAQAPSPATPAQPASSPAGEKTAREAVTPVDKGLTALEQGFARLSGDTVKMKIGFFFQGGWLNDDAGFSVASPPTTGRSTTSGNQFFVRRARLFFDGQVTEKLGFKLSTEFADASGRLLRDAFVWADYIPYARVTLGQQKVPFGLETVEALASNATINRSMAMNFIHAPTLRDIGVTLSGRYQAKPAGLPFGVSYALGAYNGSGMNATDDNHEKDIAARVVVNPLVAGLNVGGSLYKGETHVAPVAGEPFERDRSRWAAEADYNPPYLKGLKLRGEYVWDRKYFAAYASRNITLTTGLPNLGRHAHAYGWYALAAYRLDGLEGYWRYLNGFEPVARYDFLDEDSSVSDNERRRTTVGFNYWLTKGTRLMLNYEMIRADGRLRARSIETIDTVSHDLLTTQFQVRF